jgi:hypothetical protein
MGVPFEEMAFVTTSSRSKRYTHEDFPGPFRLSCPGVLHGFDRLVCRGHLRQLSYAHGMDCYLSANRVLLKDFERHAIQRTRTLIDASPAEARRLVPKTHRYQMNAEARKKVTALLAARNANAEHLTRNAA